MKSILIMGYGQYGHLVEELAADCGYDKIAALDDAADDALDTIDNFAKYQNQFDDFIVAIGNPASRRAVVDKVRGTFNLTTLIHPTAVISKSAVIEPGCIIEPYVVVHTSAVVKESCLINAGAVINHDSTVEAYSHVGCNAVVGARALVPEGTKVEHCEWYR
ncbi:PglD-related sugar-binding protein [Pseudobutyrivibrio sp.]|uniref:PglD-related sugar-binding protein n=1 Tax=Pseudobutyrivibrio sp. TaxID=2014367 RepID=UPI001D266CEA|nr:hypothetical protein [Pseudobutyrivibrio sp.]MBE5912253.1 hypothetical protein [Pseudobutyrivibrio sp.]